MLRGAGQNHPSYPSSTSAAGGPAALGLHRFDPSPQRRQDAALERRTGLSRVVGFGAWVIAGGAALFAAWELGNFSVLVGNAPLLPSAVREAPPSGAFHPAAGSEETPDGCTQAPIDRATGHTIPSDCHT